MARRSRRLSEQRGSARVRVRPRPATSVRIDLTAVVPVRIPRLQQNIGERKLGMQAYVQTEAADGASRITTSPWAPCSRGEIPAPQCAH